MAEIEIINGDHIPPGAFMRVGNYGVMVDLSSVPGELWDQATSARVEWGLKELSSGKIYGRVTLKNGQGRTFYDKGLMTPYLTVFEARATEEKAKHAANMQARKAEADKRAMKQAVDEGMARANRAQAEQEQARG